MISRPAPVFLRLRSSSSAADRPRRRLCRGNKSGSTLAKGREPLLLTPGWGGAHKHGAPGRWRATHLEQRQAYLGHGGGEGERCRELLSFARFLLLLHAEVERVVDHLVLAVYFGGSGHQVLHYSVTAAVHRYVSEAFDCLVMPMSTFPPNAMCDDSPVGTTRELTRHFYDLAFSGLQGDHVVGSTSLHTLFHDRHSHLHNLPQSQASPRRSSFVPPFVATTSTVPTTIITTTTTVSSPPPPSQSTVSTSAANHITVIITTTTTTTTISSANI